MPKIINTKFLTCKIVGNNFDTFVQNFINLEELTYITEDFIQIDQDLSMLKKLQKFQITCESKEIIKELKTEFSLKFFNS